MEIKVKILRKTYLEQTQDEGNKEFGIFVS
jgi:hypothetical protein